MKRSRECSAWLKSDNVMLEYGSAKMMVRVVVVVAMRVRRMMMIMTKMRPHAVVARTTRWPER